MGLRDILELLRDEVVPPVNYFTSRLAEVPASVATSLLDVAGQALSQRLYRLADLVEVFGDDIIVSQDRIELLVLLKSVCSELEPRAHSMGVRVDLQEPAQSLPPIYGNERLIRRALYECLDNAFIHSRKEVVAGQKLRVEIRFTLSGEHVLLSVRNQGVTQLAVKSQDELLPFATAKQGTEKGSTTRWGLPLVQRIVGLHGGNMRLNTADEETVQVLLEFPTGAPQRGHVRMDIAQAQRYAHDLAQLMSRRKKEAA